MVGSNSGLVLTVASNALLAVYTSKRRSASLSFLISASYLSITSSFLLTAAGILITMAVYLAGLALLHIALGRLKHWTLLRIDVLSGGAVAFVLDVAYWAKNLADLKKNGTQYLADGTQLVWLMLIVDATLALITAGVVAVAGYVIAKLKKRTEVDLGNVRDSSHPHFTSPPLTKSTGPVPFLGNFISLASTLHL
jgi:hypothetical protein